MIGICPICGLKAELRKPTIISFVREDYVCAECDEFYTKCYEEWAESDPDWDGGEDDDT